MKHNTWILVNLSRGCSIVSTKWIFSRKYNLDGTLVCYKARFIARGFSQQEGIDYYDTFSPVIKTKSFRLLFAIATLHDYHIHQMDVIIAFLHAKLKETIHICKLKGFIQYSQGNKVCLLLKSLYRLKQSVYN